MTLDEQNELVIRFRNGDREAGESLILDHIPWLRGCARHYSRRFRTLLFDDVFQVSAMALLEAAEKHDVTKGFRLVSLAKFIVKNRVGKMIRRDANSGTGIPFRRCDELRAEASLSAPDDDGRLLEVADRDHWDGGDDPRIGAVRRAIPKLPAIYRDAIERHYFGGQPVSRMAEETQVPVGTAKRRLHAARYRIREMVSEDRSVA